MSFYVAPMQINQTFYQRKSDPKAALGSAKRSIGLEEKIIKMAQRFLIHADTGVIHRQHCFVVPTFDLKTDPATGFCIFDGVA